MDIRSGNDMERLLPCPFCGSEAKRKRIMKVDCAFCTRCGVSTGIDLWNCRQPPSLESVRSEGLERSAKVLAALEVTDSEIQQDNEQSGPRPIFQKGGQITVRDVLEARRALSPARVAEGEQDRYELARKLLQEFGKLGQMETARKIVDFVLDRSTK